MNVICISEFVLFTNIIIVVALFGETAKLLLSYYYVGWRNGHTWWLLFRLCNNGKCI